MAPHSHSTMIGGSFDITEIVASIGEVAYRWQLDSDALAWSSNACNVLNISNPAAIATGRGFAHILAPGTSHSRYDAIVNSALRDSGSGVFYQVQYAVSPNASVTPFWVEDTGRWFAGPDGPPGARPRDDPDHQ